MELSEWVRSARKSKSLTLEALGAALGRTKANVSQWERGHYAPSYQQIKRISEFTGYPMPNEVDVPANEMHERAMCGDDDWEGVGPILKIPEGAGKSANIAAQIDAAVSGGKRVLIVESRGRQEAAWPFSRIKRERWEALSEGDRGYIEGKLEALIEQAEAAAGQAQNRGAA